MSVSFFSPYVSEAFGNERTKYSKWNETADEKNLGEIINSLGYILKVQFDLEKEKTWVEIGKRKFNKVGQIRRNENIVFNGAIYSFNNTAT